MDPNEPNLNNFRYLCISFYNYHNSQLARGCQYWHGTYKNFFYFNKLNYLCISISPI